MTETVPIDTDVLLKIAAWQLGDAFIDVIKQIGIPGTLELTHLIASTQLDKMNKLTNSNSAQNELHSILTRLERLEPTNDEIALASEFEDFANENGLPLDRGESQLLAIVLIRGNPALATGDKRAISSISALLNGLGKPDLFRKCIICLEQIMSSIISGIGVDNVQSLVCIESDIDKTISICLRCGRQPSESETQFCLNSYINNLEEISSHALIQM